MLRNIVCLSLIVFALLSTFLKASAQSAEGRTRQGEDTIVFMNGKKINVNVLSVQESTIKYVRLGNLTSQQTKKKIHSIKPYRVFAIDKSNGTEQVIFKPDTLDPNDFTVPQLRMFIKGEQTARTGYHNGLNKTCAFVTGAASSFFSIYGLVGPALYSTIVGASSPDINKQKNVDQNYISDPDYKEGYLKTARDKKIKNSFVAGMIGFAVGFTTQAVIGSIQRK